MKRPCTLLPIIFMHIGSTKKGYRYFRLLLNGSCRTKKWILIPQRLPN